MKSTAKTPDEYLTTLPLDRREALGRVRAVILKNLDPEYEEGMQYGMIGYYVPHRIYPAGYHCNPKEPLPLAAIGSQKNHMVIHMMCLYGSEDQTHWFREAWLATGRKLDMGKGCVRFKKLEDIPLEVLAEAIRRVPAKTYIARYEEALRGRRK